MSDTLHLLSQIAIVAGAYAVSALLPDEVERVDTVDRIEINTIYANGFEKPATYKQFIFWDWNSAVSADRWDVVDWRAAEPYTIKHLRPGYEMEWNDKGCYRRVRASCWYVTKSTFDPEVEARRQVATDERRGLTRR